MTRGAASGWPRGGRRSGGPRPAPHPTTGERERERDTETERDRDRDRDRVRETETERDRERNRNRERERHRHTHTHIHTQKVIEGVKVPCSEAAQISPGVHGPGGVTSDLPEDVQSDAQQSSWR